MSGVVPMNVIPEFGWAEWVVFGSVLAISTGIGIFFGCFGQKNKTNEEYLLGGRKMNPVPVALSLLCSYVSSITLLGAPVEIYFYGMQLSMVLLAYIPLTLSLAFIFVPHYFVLQYISIFEYLEDRFSRFLRIVCSLINIIYGIFFMALVVYAPSLALSLVIGIDHRILVAVIFIVCIFYSSIGGFKAVLWTDSLQAVIMVLSMAVVVILGVRNAGGLSEVWRLAGDTGRLNFFNFDADPRTRHTFWTAVIGGYFQWLPMYANQAQIQRYVSLPNYRAVYIALLINLVGLFVLMGMTYFAGIVIYANYYQCDPVLSGAINLADQLLPLFVAQTLEKFPGLPGLFVAGITCAGLSTVSSGINALAASVVEDYVKKWRPAWDQAKLGWASKVIATVAGILAFGFVFIAEQMGNIFSAATSLFGIFGGPTFGVYICGMFFPWTNNLGVSLGLFGSVSFMSFMAIGQTIYGNRRPQQLPIQWKDLNLESCSVNSTNFNELDWKSQDWSDLQKIFSISPLWYPMYGMLSCIVLGLLFSLLVHKRSKVVALDSKLTNPAMLKIWKWACPGRLIGYVKFTQQEILENPKLAGSTTPNEDIVGTYLPTKKSLNGVTNVGFVSENEVKENPSEKEMHIYGVNLNCVKPGLNEETDTTLLHNGTTKS